MALPPRKLDLFTGCLAGGSLLAANHLYRERYGDGLLTRIARGDVQRRHKSDLIGGNGTDGAVAVGLQGDLGRAETGASGARLMGLPTARAKEVQAQFRAARERQDGGGDGGGGSDNRKDEGVLDKMWYGHEDRDGWKEKRDKEVREKLEEGKGIGDVILDQIWEVWNWRKVEDGGERKSAK